MKTVFDVLISKIEARKLAVKGNMSTGACKDYADYKYACGQLRGLKSALNEIADLAKQQMEDDDD